MLIFRLPSASHAVTRVCISPDENHVAAIAAGEAYVVNTRGVSRFAATKVGSATTWTPNHRPSSQIVFVRDTIFACYYGDGVYLAEISGRIVHICDYIARRIQSALGGIWLDLWQFAYRPAENCLYGSRSTTWKWLLNTQGSRIKSVEMGDFVRPSGMLISSDGAMVATCENTNSIAFYVPDGSVVGRIKGKTIAADAAVILSTTLGVLVIARARTLQVFETPSGRLLYSESRSSCFRAVTLTHTEKYMYACSGSSILVYCTRTWRVAELYNLGCATIYSVDVSAQGMMAVAGCRDGRLVVWDIDLF
jgi:hypothetical protein